ncbi:hypothetical protein V6C53_17640 [Desulfocurvibacter africanus]|uniref:hypothetical protein n=1 Tax=Desulfocurvibacter africanus TaxID=873 RepID=UPI002FD89142
MTHKWLESRVRACFKTISPGSSAYELMIDSEKAFNTARAAAMKRYKHCIVIASIILIWPYVKSVSSPFVHIDNLNIVLAFLLPLFTFALLQYYMWMFDSISYYSIYKNMRHLYYESNEIDPVISMSMINPRLAFPCDHKEYKFYSKFLQRFKFGTSMYISGFGVLSFLFFVWALIFLFQKDIPVFIKAVSALLSCYNMFNAMMLQGLLGTALKAQ